MNVVMIGCSGHSGIVVEAVQLRSDICIAAIAPGCAGEDMSGLRRTLPQAAYFEDWRSMLDQVQADVAVVNPWFGLCAEITAACLERGLHVYAEKPLATTLEKLSLVEKTWRSSGKALGGMFNYRVRSWFLAAQEAVRQGMIGDVRLIHAQKSYRMGTRPDFFRQRELMGGLIPWVAIHAIDWVCAFGTPCRWVSAFHTTKDNRGHGDMEASSAILMGMEDGVIATVTADYFRPQASARHDDDRLRLTGTRGMLEVVDGCVWVENDQPKSMLELPPTGNAFLAFMDAVQEGRSEEFTLPALYATRLSLLARESADADGVRMDVE